MNPVTSYRHRTGPLVAKKLFDSNISIVIAPEFGPGVPTLLKQHNMEKVLVRAGTLVSEAVKKLRANRSATMMDCIRD